MQILGVANSYASEPVNAPTSLSTVPSTTSVAISFTAPTNDGGTAITNYEYSFNNSSWTALSPADTTSPITISGLSAGTAYTVYLRAVNIVGAGPASAGTSFTTLQLSVHYFVLGGGGGGASANSWNGFVGSGGGGGGITTSYGSTNGGGNAMSAVLNGLAGTTQTVQVGGGGGGGAGNTGWSAGRNGSSGGSSVFASITSTGGTGGRNGGGGAPAGSLGYTNSASNNYWAIGGSSAAGSAGANATRTGTPYGGIHGAAGNGIATLITGSSITRGGAGGNGSVQNSNGGINVYYTNGGAGGGGRGGGYGNSAGAAQGAGGSGNYGAGGGSGGWYPYGGQGSGGAGGSGYVAIRYPDSYGTLTSISGGLAYSTTTDGSDRVYQFTSGTGTITFPSY